MTDYDFKATAETDDATFTFEGDRPQAVSAQAARMPVLMNQKQIEMRIDLKISIERYLEHIANQQEEMKEKSKQLHPSRNRRD